MGAVHGLDADHSGSVVADDLRAGDRLPIEPEGDADYPSRAIAFRHREGARRFLRPALPHTWEFLAPADRCRPHSLRSQLEKGFKYAIP